VIYSVEEREGREERGEREKRGGGRGGARRRLLLCVKAQNSERRQWTLSRAAWRRRLQTLAKFYSIRFLCGANF